MSRKRKKSSSEEEVQLNLAAMLDMAFQLLTFFILTFKPAPLEGQIALRMPPPQALNSPDAKVQAGQTESKDNAVQGFNTLAIILASDAKGKLTNIYLGGQSGQEVPVDEGPLTLLNQQLGKMLNNPATPFDQVVIQVPAQLHYYELMRVMGVCTKQTIGGDPTKKLSKLSLVDEKNLPIQ